MWNEAAHPRATDGRFGHVAGSPRALPVQRMGESGSGEGSTSSGKPKLETSAQSGFSSDEMARLKPHMPQFLYEKMSSASAQHIDRTAGLSAMGAFEITEETARLPREKGAKVTRIKGRLASEEEIKTVRKSLHDAKIRMIIGGEELTKFLDDTGNIAAFDPVNIAVLLRGNPTFYEMTHEYLHAVHWKLVGAEEFGNLTKYEKELYVFKGLTSLFESGDLNADEVTHAKLYIESVKNDPLSHMLPKKVTGNQKNGG